MSEDELKNYLAEKLITFVQYNLPRDKKLLEMDNVASAMWAPGGKLNCVLMIKMQHGFPRYFQFKISEILGS